jgi:hypothetical protein
MRIWQTKSFRDSSGRAIRRSLTDWRFLAKPAVAADE